MRDGMSIRRLGLALRVGDNTVRQMIDEEFFYRGVPRGAGVYVISGARLHKIGQTSGFSHRLSDLQTCSPVTLRLVRFYWEDDDQARWQLEDELHAAFADHRQHGEWFAMPRGWKPLADAVADGVAVPV